MTTVSRRTLLTGTACALLSPTLTPAAAVASPRRLDPAPALDWNQALLRIVRTPGAQPPTVQPTRGFAMTHAAMYRAALAGPAVTAAVAQAAHDVLVSLYPMAVQELDALLRVHLATAHDVERGVRAGRAAARRMIERRTADGSSATPPALPPGTEPGEYRPTPPAFSPPVFTHWAAVTPFVLNRADQFRPPPYPDLTSTRYASAMNAAASIGRDTSTTRTADQTVQARFWAGPIWNYWNEIAQTVLRPTDLMTATRVFAQLNLTMADAVIAFYDAKYHHRIWRPITAIRLADTDGNPATTADPTWTSLVTTSPDPSYPGGHSVVGRAAATVLAATTGDRHQLVVTSEVLPGTTRTFTRLHDAGNESGEARLYGGVHTRLDHEAGQRIGMNVARAVLARTW